MKDEYKVLMVDDDVYLLSGYEDILSITGGFQPLVTKNPIDALDIVQAENPDVIFLDIMMPRMNGFELCQRIRAIEACKEIPIIFCSAAEERIKDALSSADDFLVKPFDAEEFIEKVHTWATRHDARNEWKTAPTENRTGIFRGHLFNAALNGYFRVAALELLLDSGQLPILDTLLSLVPDSEPIVRSEIARRLGEIHNEQSWDTLVQFLQDVSERVRETTVNSLASFPNRRAVEPLIHLLASEKTPSVVKVIVKALGRLEDDRAIEPLVNLIGTQNRWFNWSVQDALEKLNRDQVVLLLIRRLSDPNAEVRAAVAEMLGKFEDRRARKPLRQLRHDPDEKVRKAVKEALLKIPDEKFRGLAEEVVRKLHFAKKFVSFFKRTAQRPDDTNIHAVQPAKKSVPPLTPDPNLKTIDTLRQSLTVSDEVVRGNAVIELAKHQREDWAVLKETPAQDAFWHNVRHSLPSFTSSEDAAKRWARMADLALALTYPKADQNKRLQQLAAQGESVEVRAQALIAFGQNRGTGSLETLRKAAEDADKTVRRAAIEALGHLGDGQVVKTIHAALSDPSPSVRLAATNALAAVGTDEAVEMLREALTHNDNSMRVDAAMALARVEQEKATDILLAAIETETNHDVLHTITLSLGQLHHPKAVPGLEKLAGHENEHVREGAKKALDEY